MPKAGPLVGEGVANGRGAHPDPDQVPWLPSKGHRNIPGRVRQWHKVCSGTKVGVWWVETGRGEGLCSR